jgi:hypothetical protein
MVKVLYTHLGKYSYETVGILLGIGEGLAGRDTAGEFD